MRSGRSNRVITSSTFSNLSLEGLAYAAYCTSLYFDNNTFVPSSARQLAFLLSL